MTIELKTITVGELHAQLAHLIDQGLQDLPVCATDCRARYPFTAYTVLNPSGYVDALLICPRPDAYFAQRDPLPVNWSPTRVTEWNEIAQEVKRRRGAFAPGLSFYAGAPGQYAYELMIYNEVDQRHFYDTVHAASEAEARAMSAKRYGRGYRLDKVQRLSTNPGGPDGKLAKGR